MKKQLQLFVLFVFGLASLVLAGQAYGENGERGVWRVRLLVTNATVFSPSTIFVAAAAVDNLSGAGTDIPDGTEGLRRPMVSATQSVKEVMTIWLINLMNFVEYFVGRSLQVRMVNYGLQFNRQEDPNVPHWDVFYSYSENLEELIATGVLKPRNSR
jgi:hypothetical protein